MGPSQAEPSAAVQPPPGRSGVRTWILAGVVAVVIGVGAFIGLEAFSGRNGSATVSPSNSATAAANGAPGAGRSGFGRPVSYTVTSIDGSTIEVTDANGVVTKVTTTGDTSVTSNDVVTLGDLRVGDHVRAVGTGTESAITADRITDSGDKAPGAGFAGRGLRNRQGSTQGNAQTNGPAGTVPGGAPSGGAPSGGAPNGVAPNGGATPNGAPGNGGAASGRASASGTIASIDGSTITVTTSAGPSVVTVSGSTVVTKSTPISVSDLKAGDSIVAFGTTSGDTLAATDIVRGQLGFGPGRR